MGNLKRAVNKEEFFAITGDSTESIILNQFIYWSERVKDFDKFIKEENDRQEKYFTPTNKDGKPEKINLIYGWVYKKAAEMKDEIMVSDSEKTINRKINNLVEKGFLDRRNNPYLKYDRTYQYRVNFENIIGALLKKGYSLEGYKININMYKKFFNDSNINKGQNDDSNVQEDEESKSQIDALKSQVVLLKNQIDAFKRNSVGAIPEITTETISETTTDNIINKNLNPIRVYQENIFYLPGKIEINSIVQWSERLSEEIVIFAIQIAAKNNARRLEYIEKILIDWDNRGIKTVEQAQIYTKQRNEKSKKEVVRGSKKESTFNDFKQRDYDFKDLKNKLLGWNGEK